MTDLKQEIERLAKLPHKEKFEGIVKVAYQRNELIKLLSGAEEYLYDAAGNLWLAPQAALGPDDNVIAIDRIANMVNRICNDFGIDNVKAALVSALTEMLQGTPEQVYYAVCVYTYLAGLEDGGLSNFSNWVYDQYFTKEFHPVVLSAIQNRAGELKSAKLACLGGISSVYAWCEICSKKLMRYGFESITKE